jgi:hypothetical protein
MGYTLIAALADILFYEFREMFQSEGMDWQE